MFLSFTSTTTFGSHWLGCVCVWVGCPTDGMTCCFVVQIYRWLSSTTHGAHRAFTIIFHSRLHQTNHSLFSCVRGCVCVGRLCWNRHHAKLTIRKFSTWSLKWINCRRQSNENFCCEPDERKKTRIITLIPMSDVWLPEYYAKRETIRS